MQLVAKNNFFFKKKCFPRVRNVYAVFVLWNLQRREEDINLLKQSMFLGRSGIKVGTISIFSNCPAIDQIFRKKCHEKLKLSIITRGKCRKICQGNLKKLVKTKNNSIL
jgi:hypothetical protein